ncbi:MAG: alkaline phosphatase family protein [Acidimicrobiales bacterium]
MDDRADEPVVPAYGGACITDVMPAILDRHDERRPWLPEPLAGASQAVLLVLDGLGWEQLQERRHLAPTLAAMVGGPVTTVVPSTTATALTSLTTAAPPAVHGVVGYRMKVPAVTGIGDAAGEEVLNVLRWSTATGDARQRVLPESIQPVEAFRGKKPAVVTRSDFADTGFSRAHLAGSELFGWRYPSTLVVRVAELIRDGREFVYAYYPGVDTVAHEWGFGPLYDAELAAADRIAADLLAALPEGTALAVVSDHGQVQVGDRLVPIHPEVAALTRLLSGEGRFRWLHARPGLEARLLEAATEHHGDQAWARSRDQVVEAGWVGGVPRPEVAARYGNVALVAREPVAFVDPAERGHYDLVCRHGSLTKAEMLVPFVAARA